jgi:hypothetical protein
MKNGCAIAVDQVPVVFDDRCVKALASVGKLPAGADLERFARSLRGAVGDYVLAARAPSSNDLSREIGALLRAANRKKYDEVGYLLDRLSLEAREWLDGRGKPQAWRWILGEHVAKLPLADALRDPARRNEACARVSELCTVGGQIVEGRRRPGGKRSRTYRPALCAPKPSRYRTRLEAELDLVAALQTSFVGAADRMPALTARHASAHRRPGPFARMVQKVLHLAGSRADAVGLINELNRRRHVR